ncbi:hypothetical protein [Thauera sp.]|uniref:hypothetical protein n=1 Tax=Thauera sp. TaxID=1905334 RepID=UPI001B419A68|nr:hypothetical protein [Thauera sp.]MBP6131377.1 hypothetical protein [Thauera sp.]MBP7047248.1 hypothetical protein [Thauera sp.]
METARGAASRTGPIAILWLVAVAVSWWSIESEVIAQTVKAASATREYSFAAKRYQEAKESLQAHELRTDAKDDAKDESKRAELTAAEKQLDNATSMLQASRTGTVEFKLPTFPGFKVGTKIAPGILSAIVLILALYLTRMRATTCRYLALALRIRRRDFQEPMETIGEVLGPRLWWIAPLPKRSGQVVSANDFAHALGWHQPKNAARWQVFLFWLVLLAIHLRTTYLGVAFLHEFVGSSLLRGAVDVTLVNALQAIYVLLFGLSASLAFGWLRPRSVPDEPIEFPSETHQERREALTHLRNAAVLVVASHASTVRLFSAILSRSFRRVPRFKRARRPLTSVAGADGLRNNHRSAVLHVAIQGHLVGLRNARVGDWKDTPVDASSFQVSKPNRSSISPTAEFAAKALIAAGKVDDGLRLLLRAIYDDFSFKLRAGLLWLPTQRRRKPRRRRREPGPLSASHTSPPKGQLERPIPAVSVRLYDLLAKEAIRGNRADILNELGSFVAKQNMTAALGSRTSAWSAAAERMQHVR